MNVKALVTLTLLPLSLAKGALIANIVTDKGTIQVDLQYAKTPKTVANFITMAQATRPRVDPKTGQVIKKPLYIGEKFFRVENTSTFKIIQTGSGTGDTTGVPGFTIKEEFDATLTHVPYVMSMANAGPNTSSSQIYLTGNVTLASLNNAYTVFGLVTDAPSRTVIDAILAAGANNSTVTDVSFDRTDGAAQAFNELAQDLPTVTVPAGSMAVQPGVSATWNLTTPLGSGSFFRAYRSNTLATGSWAELTAAKKFVGLGAPSVSAVTLDAAPAPKAFYHMSVANHPGSVTPSSLANRTVSVNIDGDIFSYAFDATGTAGTFTLTQNSAVVGSAPFTSANPSNGSTTPPYLPYSMGGHDINFDAFCPQFQYHEIWVKVGCDSATATTISGHVDAQYFFDPFGWQPLGKGTATITR